MDALTLGVKVRYRGAVYDKTEYFQSSGHPVGGGNGQIVPAGPRILVRWIGIGKERASG
jgi:hypothetical protein